MYNSRFFGFFSPLTRFISFFVSFSLLFSQGLYAQKTIFPSSTIEASITDSFLSKKNSSETPANVKTGARPATQFYIWDQARPHAEKAGNETQLSARSEIRSEGGSEALGSEVPTIPQDKWAQLQVWSAQDEWSSTVLANVQAWYSSSAVDEGQRAALLRLIQESKGKEIVAGFSSPTGVLQPGTAGTRGPMENFEEMKIGPNYFSRTTVIQYTWAFVDWYKSTGQTGAVFITKEVRDNSDEYGYLSARILLNNGIPVVRITKPVSTPFASFFAKWLGGGVEVGGRKGKPAFGYQISASHNKLSDNGIKFMGPDGQQLMPDFMDAITSKIPPLKNAQGAPELEISGHPLYHELTEDEFKTALNAYFDAIDSTMDPSFKEVIRGTFVNAKEPGNRFVFTFLNGASGNETKLYLERLGLQEGSDYLVPEGDNLLPNQLPPDILEQKREQNADPANDKVLAPAVAFADTNGITTVFARDPDGDRFVIAIKVDGQWLKFDGNQNATLMLHDRLSQLDVSQGAQSVLLMRSHATTGLLDKIAQRRGLGVTVVPVGFKYFGAVTIPFFSQPSAAGRRFFGAEESYGTSNGHINEKDGLSALVNMLLIIARQQQNHKRSVLEYLNSIYIEFGYPGDSTINIPLPGASKPEQDAARSNVKGSLSKLQVGQKLGRFVVQSIKTQVEVEGVGSFHDGYDLVLSAPEKKEPFRLLFRASGTEPIFKAYFSWQEPVLPTGAADLARIVAETKKYVGEVVQLGVANAFSGMVSSSETANKDARSEVRRSGPVQSAFHNLRVVVDFNHLKGANDDRIRELFYLLQSMTGTGGVVVYNFDSMDQLAKVLSAAPSPLKNRLLTATGGLEQAASKHLVNYQGEIVVLSGGEPSEDKASQLRLALSRARVDQARVSFLIDDGNAGTVGAGLSGIQIYRLSKQLPDFLKELAQGWFRVTDPSVVDLWGERYDATVAFARAA